MLTSGLRTVGWVTVGSMVSLVSALAQQTAPAPPAAAPAVPAAWAQGRKPDQEGMNLSPHPPPLTALALEEIPIGNVKLPEGFGISVWASGIPNARSMTFGKNGTLFVGTRFVETVYAIVDHGDRREVKPL